MAKKNNNSGKEAFEKYYSEIYGERWIKIKEAFVKEPCYYSFQIKNDSEAYYLDYASYFAANVLPLEEAHEILDMCAAPGGKTLVLASRMNAEAKLQSNERSGERRNRLIKNISDFLPENISSRITVTSYDGSIMCKTTDKSYDAILLDAPCSSDRHVLNDEKYLSMWSLARTKNLSFTQWSLLSSAWRLLAENGFLLYATCSISPAENDEVIKKLLKKFPDAKINDINSASIKQINNFDFLVIEKTNYGYMIMPDLSNNAGPLYFSLVKKI
jgi:16S rRNA C967 or C1407 C5-methylase (RsmB/RsmF family)